MTIQCLVKRHSGYVLLNLNLIVGGCLCTQKDNNNNNNKTHQDKKDTLENVNYILHVTGESATPQTLNILRSSSAHTNNGHSVEA